jgi:hypothetical protein
VKGLIVPNLTLKASRANGTLEITGTADGPVTITINGGTKLVEPDANGNYSLTMSDPGGRITITATTEGGKELSVTLD